MHLLGFLNKNYSDSKTKEEHTKLISSAIVGGVKSKFLTLANLDFQNFVSIERELREFITEVSSGEIRAFTIFDYSQNETQLKNSKKILYLDDIPDHLLEENEPNILVRKGLVSGDSYKFYSLKDISENILIQNHIANMKEIMIQNIESILSDESYTPPRYCGVLCTNDFNGDRFWYNENEFSILIESLQVLYEFSEHLKLTDYKITDVLKKCTYCDGYYLRFKHGKNSKFCSAKCKNAFNKDKQILNNQ